MTIVQLFLGCLLVAVLANLYLVAYIVDRECRYRRSRRGK